VTKILNLIHNPDFQPSDTLWDKRILNNYNYGNMHLPIKKEKIEDLKDKLSKEFDLNFYVYNYPTSKTHIAENEKCYIQIDELKESVIHFFSSTRKIDKKIFDIYLEFKEEYENYISFEEINYINGKISSKYKSIELKHLENILPEFYPFINTDLLIESFLKSNENLMILAGEPGTGKSKFISLILKWILLNNFKNDYTVGIAKDINLLNNDEFWSKVSNLDLLIFDDLDFMLGSRNENREDIQKNNFLSKLLSFTDGVIKKNTKIIITTNQPINEIDKALLREGRIFEILNFRKLKKEEAKKIFKIYDIDYEINDEYISQAKVGSIIDKKIKKIDNSRSYLLEDGISILHSKKITKKAGFI